MLSERRLLYRQGTLFLLFNGLVGIVTASGVPHAPKWMQAHLSGLLTGVLLIAFGALWPELRLSDATRRRALWMGLVGAWVGWISNLWAAIVNLPGPATEPGRAPDAMWHLYVLFAMLAVIVPTTLGAFFLVWRGLRGNA
jgi:hydroxylaminobenzene mutase